MAVPTHLNVTPPPYFFRLTFHEHTGVAHIYVHPPKEKVNFSLDDAATSGPFTSNLHEVSGFLAGIERRRLIRTIRIIDFYTVPPEVIGKLLVLIGHMKRSDTPSLNSQTTVEYDAVFP